MNKQTPKINLNSTLENFNQSQQIRIKFIDFYLFFLGKISRKELRDTFKIFHLTKNYLEIGIGV